MNALLGGQRGVSLVELMVSVAISVAVVGSLVYVYVGSRGAYRNNEAVARVQERGRFALEWMTRDLRQAGFMGCLSRGAQISFHASPMPATLPFGTALFGYEFAAEDSSDFPDNPAKTTIKRVRGDVVMIQAIDPRQLALVAEDSDVEGGKIRVAADPGFNKGDVLVVADCERAAVFTLTDKKQDGTLIHGQKISPAFRQDARALVGRFGSGPTGYFIGNNPAGQPTLYRFSGTSAAEAVVDHIEDLDFLYGVDEDGDGVVDSYRKADDPYFTAAGLTSAERTQRWDRVLSVRVSLVASSGELTVQAAKGDKAALQPGQAGQVLYFRDEDGDTVVDKAAPSTDRQLRQVFTTTVALRNRLP